MLRFTVLAVSLFPVASHGQQAPDRQAPVKSPPPFVFEAGTVELGEIVARCAVHLQQNILLDERETQGNGKRPVVTFQQPIVTDRNGCEEMLQSLLWSQGLAVVPVDEAKGVFEVLSMVGPRSREIQARVAIRTPEQVSARPSLRQWVVVACPLAHVNSNVAANSLRGFFSAVGNLQPGLSIGSAGSERTLLVSGPQDMVAVALQLVRASDVQQGDAQTEQGQQIKALQLQNQQLAARLAEVEARVQRLDPAGSNRDTDAAKSPR